MEDIPARSSQLVLNDNSGVLSKRCKLKVIHCVRYHIHQVRENYFREMVKLFHPWRDEYRALEIISCELKYNSNITRI